MSPGESSSQRSSAGHRSPANPHTTQSSNHAIDYPSTPSEAVWTIPAFRQDILDPDLSLSVDSAGFAVHRDSSPGVWPDSRNETSSLISERRLTESHIDSVTPFSGPAAPFSIDSVTPTEQLPLDHQCGLGIASHHASIVSQSYAAGPMQQNNPHYTWANRLLHPSQTQPEQINQEFAHSGAYSSPGFPTGYHGQPRGPIQGYQHQESHAAYLTSTPGATYRQNQARSPSFPRHFQQHSAPRTPPPSDQTILPSSASYTMNQPSYYFPDALHLPSSYPSSTTSVSPPAQSMVAAESVYSSPDSLPATFNHDQQTRIVSQRTRPQCWDHGCNGREFSTFSNLLRHQRERSGVVPKAECPNCGAAFTRSTARNIHVAQGKCKSGRESSAE